jgi:expansin (peptidoglycan-binding protein)
MAKIVDRCPRCVGGNIDLDLSVFTELGLQKDGKIHGITWEIVDA